MFFPVADDQVDHYATSVSVQALAAAITSCGGAIPQNLAWARIESIRHALHRRHRLEVGALRKIAADQAIRMFVQTAFPRRIRSGKAERRG